MSCSSTEKEEKYINKRTNWKWDIVIKIVLSSDQEKLSKFEAEGREFAKYLRSLEEFIKKERSEQFLVKFIHVYILRRPQNFSKSPPYF